MADEHVLHLGLELLRGPVEEAARGVGDRPVVVADLVDDHAAQVDADLLLRHARNADLALMSFEREAAHPGDAGSDQASTPGDDAESHALAHAVRDAGWCGSPEMISASSGSATRHAARNSSTSTSSPPMMIPKIT